MFRRQVGGKRRVAVWILGALALWVTVGIGTDTNAQGKSGTNAQEKKVRIGALLPLTGPMAKFGEDARRAIQLVEEQINQQGGIRSMGGAKVEVVYADHQARPDVGMAETGRLIEKEKVSAVFDFPPSAVTLPASMVAEKLRTPYYCGISYADAITERGFKYVFEQVPTAFFVAKAQIEFLDYLGKRVGRKLSKVGLLYEDTDYGKSLAAGYKEILPAMGFTVAADVAYPAKTPNLDPYLIRLKSAKPDAVLQGNYLADTILLTKAADKLDLNIPFVDSGGRQSPAYLKAVGSLAEGEVSLAYWNRDIRVPASEQLVRKFESRYKEAAESTHGLYFQVMLTLKAALEKAGSADPEALRKALSEIEITPGPNLVLPYPKIKFNEKGLNTTGSFLVTQIKNGVFVTVWPEKFATEPFTNIKGWK